MTTCTIHPNQALTTKMLERELERLAQTPGEIALTLRVILRDGVPRKVRVTQETDTAL